MFDKTNPAHLLALKNEVNDDPISMGYAAVIDQTQPLLKLLNDPTNNVGDETAQTELTPETLLDALDVAEYGGNQIGNTRGFIDTLLRKNEGTNLEPWRAKLEAALPTNGATRTALAAQTRPLSRAEVLFDAGTTISKTDWFAARDS